MPKTFKTMRGKSAFVLGSNGNLRGDHIAPDVLMDFGAEDDPAGFGCVTVTRRLVYGVADHDVFHALQRTDESLQNFTAVHADADLASGLATGVAPTAYLRHRNLHLGGSFHGVEAVVEPARGDCIVFCSLPSAACCRKIEIAERHISKYTLRYRGTLTRGDEFFPSLKRKNREHRACHLDVVPEERIP